MAIGRDPEFHSVPVGPSGAPEFDTAEEYSALTEEVAGSEEFAPLPEEYARPGEGTEPEDEQDPADGNFRFHRRSALNFAGVLAAAAAAVIAVTSTLPSGWSPFADAAAVSEETEESTEEAEEPTSRRHRGDRNSSEAETSRPGKETSESETETVMDGSTVVWSELLAKYPDWQAAGGTYAHFEPDGTGWFYDGSRYYHLLTWEIGVEWGEEFLTVNYAYNFEGANGYMARNASSGTHPVFTGTEEEPGIRMDPGFMDENDYFTQDDFTPAQSVPDYPAYLSEVSHMTAAQIFAKWHIFEATEDYYDQEAAGTIDFYYSVIMFNDDGTEGTAWFGGNLANMTSSVFTYTENDAGMYFTGTQVDLQLSEHESATWTNPSFSTGLIFDNDGIWLPVSNFFENMPDRQGKPVLQYLLGHEDWD